MGKPERIEGTPWDGGGLDEFGNMKSKTWRENVRPALADRRGWCDFIGVPEGRNHYFELAEQAKKEAAAKGDESEWGYYHWISADILDPGEIEAAKRDLDELTYLQEFEASFINFQGRAYYAFNERSHCMRVLYDPKQPLIFVFDFNVAPGVAAVIQEKAVTYKGQRLIGETATAVIGQVWIPRNSNTPLVCNRLISDWGDHQGDIYCYGDATGGASGTAKTQGNDWDLIKRLLRNHFGDERLYFKVPKANPSERSRINAVNSRLLTMEKRVRLVVDPVKAPQVVKDFELTQLVEGGSGEIDKKANPERSHISDAIGYYIVKEFPVRKQEQGETGISGI
jgi:hypothetical protein